MLVRRLLSVSARLAAVKSPHPDIKLPVISLPDFMWDQTRHFPDKVAIECGVTGRRYKYGEICDLCQRFACSLHRAGLKPGSTIAIVMPNTAEWPVVLLGAIQAGLTVTTANPAYTPDELARQLKDCCSQAIVTLSSLYRTVQQAVGLVGDAEKPLVIIAPGLEPDSSVPRDSVNLQDMFQSSADPSEVRCVGDVHDTIVLPYSSGTTGLPKGVMLTHRNLVSNILQINGSPNICISEPCSDSYQDVMPVILPFFHIYGMVVVMLAKLAHGVKLVTLPRFEPQIFYNLLEAHKSTILYVAPPLLLFLGSHPGLKKQHLERMRYIVTGAAPLGKLDVERFLKRCPNVGVLQAYGMTELSPAASHMCKGGTKYDSAGEPLPNTEMRIVDIETGRPLPPGEVGEVCVRGPQVMKGYFNRPEATQEMIRDNGWLHTGDLGYYDKDGSFYVVDRLKELIKVKGFQVAPAELEELLRSHPAVLDAAVIGVPDDRAGEVPKAFVVLKEKISEEEIQNYIARKVSAHKQLKGGVQFIDSIPKNPSGKILRRKLKDL